MTFLNETHQHVFQGLLEYQLLNKRQKRSLLPIIGDAASWLFGLVTESDLANIRKNIKSLATYQLQIMHVVQESISILNMSRVEIAENRQVILELGESLHALDNKVGSLISEVKKEMYSTRYFLEMYLKLDLIIAEIKEMLQNAMFYLEHLRMQLNFLSIGRLTPSTISASNLRSLLVDIKAHLPPTLALIGNPSRDLWLFYKQLTISALLEEDKIVVILNIPLLYISSQYEIYRIFSLPIPIKDVQTDSLKTPDLTARYDLVAYGLMVDRRQTNFALLSQAETETCSDLKYIGAVLTVLFTQ